MNNNKSYRNKRNAKYTDAFKNRNVYKNNSLARMQGYDLKTRKNGLVKRKTRGRVVRSLNVQRTRVPRIPRWVLERSFADQVLEVFDLPCDPTIITTTVTTGVVATIMVPDVGDVSGFGTRFSSTFDEYIITSLRVEVVPIAVSTGVTVFWWTELTVGTPSANDALEAFPQVMLQNNSNIQKPIVMEYVSKDVSKLDFITTGDLSDPTGQFNIYTNTANFGAPTAATAIFICRPFITVVFRGLKSGVA